MAKYTQAHSFIPIAVGDDAGKWESNQSYCFYMNDDATGAVINVNKNDRSNGADIPPPWTIFLFALVLCSLFSWFVYPMRISTHVWIAASVGLTTGWLLPRIHAEYIEAVFIHDIGLEKHRHLSRATIDIMFLRALKVTTTERLKPNMGRGFWRLIRPYVIYFSVAGFGLIKEGYGYFRPKKPSQNP